MRIHVSLDPDALGSSLHVVVSAPTGIIYQHQYGGTACLYGEVEGYLVPVVAGAALTALRNLFEQHFAGAGTGGHRWTPDELTELRSIVAGIVYWASDGLTEDPHNLRLDESRLSSADEAWLPVLTPDGPATLLWPNSD